MLTAAWSEPALIVDLRYSAGNAAPLLPADLPSRPRSAPLFALIGPGTPAEALAALRDRAPALITLGPAAPGSAPDLALAVTLEADRRAYDALDSGTSVDSLLSEKITKTRFDEAALAHEHTRGSAKDESPVSTDPVPANPPSTGDAPPANSAATPPPAATPAEPKDLVLQRAVQLPRACLFTVFAHARPRPHPHCLHGQHLPQSHGRGAPPAFPRRPERCAQIAPGHFGRHRRAPGRSDLRPRRGGHEKGGHRSFGPRQSASHPALAR